MVRVGPLLLAVCAACAGAPGGSGSPESAQGRDDRPPLALQTHEMLNAVLWQQSSAEYRALAAQTYALARLRLDEGLAQPDWTAALEQEGELSALPPAIMLDLDETVFDNTRFEAQIILERGRFSSADFRRWCEQADAAAVPGAAAFLRYAESRGVAVFYFSSRREVLRACTEKNLQRLGLPSASDPGRVLLDDGSTKSDRRRQVARRYRIVLLVGDNLEDFVAGSKAKPAARRALAALHAERWGRSWIVLPNPMYGHWEAAFYGFDYRSPREQQLQEKRRALDR